MQALLALYSALAGTQTVVNEGPNISKQDVPNTSLELSDILLPIAKLFFFKPIVKP